jgi:hypothetical protein
MGPDLQVRQLAGVWPLFLAGYVEAPADLAVDGALVEEAFGRVADWFASTPFPHYTAMIEYLRPVSGEHQYGFSMEHLEQHLFPDTTRAMFADTPPEARERARFNYAHHIAHSWIPKRLSGEGYFPHRWEVPPVLDTIWFSEGFARWIASEALTAAAADADRDAVRSAQRERWRGIVNGFPALFRTTSLVDLSRVGSTSTARTSGSDRRSSVAAHCWPTSSTRPSGSRRRADGRSAIRSGRCWCGVPGEPEAAGLVGEPVGVDVGTVFAKALA